MEKIKKSVEQCSINQRVSSFCIRPPEDERCQCFNGGISQSQIHAGQPGIHGVFRRRETKIKWPWFKIWSSGNTSPTTIYRSSGCIESGRLTNLTNDQEILWRSFRTSRTEYIRINAARKLHGTRIWVNEHFPPEMENRKKLYPVMRQAKTGGSRGERRGRSPP